MNGAAVTRYGYTGSGDAPSLLTDAANTVQQTQYALPGGALLTTTGAAATWTYPNVHGDLVATASPSGVKQGATTVYDPFGGPVSGAGPDNSAGGFDYGWLGQYQRPLEHETTLQPVIEMGARQYSPLLGRFLEVDPVTNGSCHRYDYVCNEPVNTVDLDGRVPACVKVRHDSGWVTQTVYIKNKCRKVVGYVVVRATIWDSPCFVIQPGKKKRYNWGKAWRFDGLRKCI